MRGLRFWIVGWHHECDYPSLGTHVERLVAAPDEATARTIADAPDDGWTRVDVTPFDGLPSLSRKRKPFVVIG